MTFRGKFIPAPSQRLAEWRCAVFVAILIAILASLPAGGALRLKFFGGDLRDSIRGAYHRDGVLPAHRGGIRDRDGRPLAMNADVYRAYADLRILRETGFPNGLANQIARILDDDPDRIRRRLDSDLDYVRLKNKIPPAVAARLRALNVRGVGAEYESVRFYPNGPVAAHVIGFTDNEGIGREGIESAAQRELVENPGRISALGASDGKPLWVSEFVAAEDGRDLHLTLDLRLQFFAYEALHRAVVRHGAKAASAVLMDAQSGDILAMANIPSFNPNLRAGGADIRRNRAVADLMEPGSVAKPFVVALALQAGLTHPDEVHPTTKKIFIRPLTVQDAHIRDDLTTAEVLQKSSNIGAVILARRLGPEALRGGLQRAGFGGGKILNLPGEAGGTLRPHDDWRPSDFATHAYGYGFSGNLLQLVRAYSAFANDGVLVSPGIVKGAERDEPVRALDAAAAKLTRDIMTGATTPDGTARRAAVPGFRSAGKTGTVFKITDGAYDSKRRRVLFVGMAPASRPRFVAAVMVDEPSKNGKTGGEVAAPVFRELMFRALLANGIVPDNWDWQNDRANKPEPKTAKVAP